MRLNCEQGSATAARQHCRTSGTTAAGSAGQTMRRGGEHCIWRGDEMSKERCGGRPRLRTKERRVCGVWHVQYNNSSCGAKRQRFPHQALWSAASQHKRQSDEAGSGRNCEQTSGACGHWAARSASWAACLFSRTPSPFGLSMMPHRCAWLRTGPSAIRAGSRKPAAATKEGEAQGHRRAMLARH